MRSTLARRIFLAHLELSYRLGRKVTLAEFGELVARQLRRATPFSAAAVSRWEAGTKVPSADVIEAIGAVTHTDPGWISHGDRSAAPAPRSVGDRPTEVTVGEPEPGVRQVAEQRPRGRSPKVKGKRRAE